MLRPLVADITHTAVVGLAFLTGLCLCCLSFCFARRKGDKERVGLVFVKVAWPLFQLYCLFDIATSILRMLFNEADISDLSEGSLHIQFQMSNVTSFLGDLTSIFVFLAIVRLGVGVLRAQDETATPPKWPRFVGWAAYAAAAFVGILTLSLWAFNLDYIMKLFSYGLFRANTDDVVVSRHLGFAIIVLFFVLALLTLCWTVAVLILTQHKEGRRLPKPAVYLLIVSIFWLMVRVYVLAEFADQVDTSSRSFNFKRSHIYLSITSAVLNFGILWVILILLVVLGRVHSYSGGLWSATTINAQYWQPGPHHQPPMSGGAFDPSKTASPYAYPPNMQYSNGYQTIPPQRQPPHTAHGGYHHHQQQQQQWQEPSPLSGLATPATDGRNPPTDAPALASSMPPRIPRPVERTDLPLTHLPTEWELPVESAAPGRTGDGHVSAAPVSDAPVSRAAVSEFAPVSPRAGASGSATAGPSSAVATG